VQIGSRRLRKNVVGGVPEQQVAKAKGVVSGNPLSIGTDQPLAHERGEVWRDLASVGKRLERATMEDLALDRGALQHRALFAVQLVESSGEQRAQRWRDRHLAVSLAGDREHLCDEQRVPSCRAGDPLAQLGGHLGADQVHDLVVLQRFEPERHRPGGPSLDEVGSRHTHQEDRRTGGEKRQVLDQIQECLLAPLDVVEDDDERGLLL